MHIYKILTRTTLSISARRAVRSLSDKARSNQSLPHLASFEGFVQCRLTALMGMMSKVDSLDICDDALVPSLSLSAQISLVHANSLFAIG